MNDILINKDDLFLDKLNDAVDKNTNLTSWELFKLNYQVRKATITTNFQELHAPGYLPHMDFLKHQITTAKTVLDDMNGRAILADEVGLGKTIEAGLILKEYMIRGTVKNALLLVPASLVSQWITELNEKFYIPVTSYRKNYRWSDYPFYVTSIDLAKRSPHREELLKMSFDMVIIDEAHKLKNQNTLNYKFVNALKKKYCLLLTATPIQNKVIELFNLVSILKPGYLGNYETFSKKYSKNNHTILDDSYLNKLIQKVMVRNRRENTILHDIKRHVHHVLIDFSKEEKTAYEMVDEFASGLSALSKITFLKELCSSREACFLSIEKSEQAIKNDRCSEVLQTISTLPHHIKAEELLRVMKEIGKEKVIIFTEYRATQFYLEWYLQKHGFSTVTFLGGLKRSRKDWITQLFKQDKQVLISTEAGGEGINLQFCSHLINYDLPWNPMRLEQRIGRIHRYGQQNDVHIYNFAIKDTIEEHILHILYQKLNIFERVIGKLDKILAHLHIDNLEDEFKGIIAGSNTLGEMNIKMNNFVSVINSVQVENEVTRNG